MTSSVTRFTKNYCSLLFIFLFFGSQVSNESLIPEMAGCKLPPSFDYAEPRDEYVNQTIFPQGEMLHYKCRPGYVPIPNTKTSITCLDNMTWSTADIFCTRGCHSPLQLEYAELREEFLDQNTFPIGAKLYYKCRPGYVYVMGTETSIVCLDSFKWSDAEKFCTRTCSHPPRLQYGELKEDYLSMSTFPIGTKVVFNCRPGYMRVPGTKTHIICMQNFQWSTPDIFCKPRSCGNPGDAMNGEFEATDFIFGSRVKYKCNTGYRMVSKRPYRDCQADGTWSNIVPECEAVICTAPMDVIDGSYDPIKEVYQYLDAVTYKCKYGLDQIGQASIHCTENGIWSSEPPQCKLISCPNPIVPNSRKLLGFSGPYMLHSAVRFECYSGFLMRGSALIKCTLNNKWEPDIPRCLGICKPPPVLDFAELEEEDKALIDQNLFIQDTTLHYKCRVGYERVPKTNNTITCLGRNQISYYENFCTRRSCGNPGDIENGNMQFYDFLYGSIVRYICHEGYKMVSDSTLRCQEDGTWSGVLPKCEVITCPTPEISNGTYHPRNKTYFYKDSLTFSCDDNLRLIGERYIECIDSGLWSSPPPKCKAVCPSPPIIKNADLNQQFADKEYFNIGTVAQYKCKPGYTRIPNTNSTITCTTNLTWSTLDIFCTRRSCGNPGEINNGRMEASDFLFGSKANYSCYTGYKMISKINYRECLADGDWSEAIPECRVQTCPDPGFVTNGLYSPRKEEYQYQDVITYECKHGLTLYGKAKRTCTEHGTWDHHAPRCKESICDEIWAMQEEMRKCSSAPDEWIKYLQIKYLYLQIEDLQIEVGKKKSLRHWRQM
ncbi:complement receptor type 1-like [Spea bombifrons]|uniref:complement receptor type 1-like n=1 Tax=Spea bombifrons TaxID=233779 RepID=UPI00234B4B70|nr:complement receptor type 1-like [Spea bombifrons]